jgi:ArsR family transcriptional regulator, cadmium/lead-responsive transcriptional repressor
MGHQELAMIDEAAMVGTSPWPLSVLCDGLVNLSRLSCLLALRERPRTIREILAATDLSQPNVSKHLCCLPDSSLVRAERSGRLVAYGVADLEVEELLGVGEALLARIGGRPDREGGAR